MNRKKIEERKVLNVGYENVNGKINKNQIKVVGEHVICVCE